MQRITSITYLMHPSEELRRLLARIPGQQLAILPAADWGSLRETLGRASPSTVFVVDPYGPRGGLAEELREVLRDFPSATILSALPETVDAAEVVRTIHSWGAADTLDMLREETPPAVARRLRSVRTRALHKMLRRALPRGVPSRSRALLMVAAEVVSIGGKAEDFAAALGVDERTVPRWCMRADLPPPRRLLAWLRVLLACELLDDPGRSIESVARACGYSAASSLKPAIRNLLGTSPAELRQREAFRTAASAFSHELFEIREAARTSGKPERDWLH